MAKSLKHFIQTTLVKVTGRGAVGLYQRQLPLVTAGLLKIEGGHGPGSGVKATPKSVATLLIALLATDTPTDTDAVAKFAKLKPRSPCSLTGKANLADALTAILEMPTLPELVWLQADRSRSQIRLGFTHPDCDTGFGETYFTVGGKPTPPQRAGLHTYIELHGLHEIARALRGEK